MSSKNVQGNKVSASESPQNIKLIVKGQDTSELIYRVKTTCPLVKLKRNYSERVGAPESCLRFLFDGRRIHDEDTPAKLEMQNEDVIEVYQLQTGGV